MGINSFEIIKGKLWQSADVRHYDQIVKRHGIDIIVNARSSSGRRKIPRGVMYFHFPMKDSLEWMDRDKWAAIRSFCRMLTVFLRQGRRVYIHCWAGKNRSGLLAVMTFSLYAGISGREAYRQAKKANPIILSNIDFRRWLLSNGGERRNNFSRTARYAA